MTALAFAPARVRRLRRQRIHAGPDDLLLPRRREQALPAEQIGEREAGDAAAEAAEQLAPRVDELLDSGRTRRRA